MSVDQVKVTSFISIFNDNFQHNMLLQPNFVKTVHKWHSSHINVVAATYCIKTQQFLKCVFSQQSGFTQSEMQMILPIPIVYRSGGNRPDTNTDGNCNVYRIIFYLQKEYNGRTIEYSVSGRVHSFKEPWVYDATAKDVDTGVFVKKKHFETADEAVYEAIEELVKQLKERKILQV